MADIQAILKLRDHTFAASLLPTFRYQTCLLHNDTDAVAASVAMPIREPAPYTTITRPPSEQSLPEQVTLVLQPP